MTSSGGLHVPVPDDAHPVPASQLPWQSIPRFTPGVTNVQEYTRKLKFLASIWPPEHLELLAPRAALQVEGSAFTLVSRLDGAKLRVKSLDGVTLLVETLGGQWGSTELEERYEYFEKAIYATTQRHDESNDSFISRMESFFTELIARKTSLEEIQAYVLLRQSTLTPEDKKKILLEHGGKLSYPPVVKSLRLMGSKFFHEFQTGKVSTKTKVYDTMFSEEHGQTNDEPPEKAIYMSYHEDEFGLDADYVESLVAQDDPDAQLVQSFEAEFEDFIQETPELHQAMISYVEARQKLLDKRKVRGFWPPKGGNKGGSKGKWQKGKGGRQGLLARIARSTCRLCNQKGHWKAECPLRNASTASSSPMPQSTAAAATANFAIPENAPQEEQEIFVDGDFSDEDFVDLCFTAVACNASSGFPQERFSFNTLGNREKLRSRLQRAVHPSSLATEQSQAIHHPISRIDSKQGHTFFHVQNHVVCDKTPLPPHRNMDVEKIKTLPAELIFQASDEKSTYAILDTGASRCIIGTCLLDKLLRRLPTDVRSQVKERPSQIKFRFGNNQTLTSQKRMYFPFLSQDHERVWLGVEVVEGGTPFLFSKRAFKQLGGILDTTKDRCTLSRLQKTIDLETNPTGLYVMDIVEFCHAQHATTCVPESFVGHTSHVEKRNSFEKASKSLVQHPWKSPPVFRKGLPENKRTELPEPCAVNSNLGPKNDKSFSVLSPCRPQDGDPHSDDQHVEGCRQRHHGHVDDRAPVVHELDRDESNPRGGRDATYDVTAAGEHVPRAEQTAQSPARDGRAAETPRWRTAGKPNKSRSTSRPRGRLLLGDQLWSQVNRTADHKTKPISWSTTSTLGDRWHSFGSGSSSTRGRSGTCRKTSFLGISLDASSDGRKSPDPCPMGPTKDHLGKEAHGQDLLSDSQRGHGLSGLEPGAIQLATAPTAGLCGLLLCPAGERCADGPPPERSEQPVLSAHLTSHGLDPMISRQIEDCRIACSRFEPYHAASRQDEQFSHALESAIQIADQVVARSLPDRLKHRCHLLEVYAGEHSPLTDAVRATGKSAYRFTRQDGDLSTLAGRQHLWSLIDKLQPEHIYVAPECGPWGGWNRLNAQKSPELWDRIQANREHEKKHIKLCAQLCQYQLSRNRHFHLEQPSGSAMIETSEFQPIKQATQQAMFDMCAFGLKIPNTDLHIKKRSQIWTSSREVHEFLDQKNCPHDHNHQVIAGTIQQAGERIRLSRFCATYCRGFVTALAQVLRDVPTFDHVHVAEDEPPMKKIRANPGVFKRPRVDKSAEPDMLSTEPNASNAQILPDDSLWHEAFRMAHHVAPRVGNTKFEAGTDLFELIQGLQESGFITNCVFVCRGTDRLQAPVNAPPSQQAPWRHVLSLHRETGKIHNLGYHNWHHMTRAQRIAKSIPSRLTITIFGNRNSNVGNVDQTSEAMPKLQDEETREVAQRVRAEGITRSTVMLPDVCEGWAPPPTPLHGPNFRSLAAQEKSQLVLLHKNLGHPDPKVLANHLMHQGAPDHVVRGAQDFVCDACVETRKPAHQRPAKLQSPIEFNDRIGLDAFYWSGKGKFQCYVIHVYDEASGFHLAKRLDGQNMDHVIPALKDMWTVWAGPPKEMYLDPAGEFRSEVWLSHLQSMNTHVHMTTEAWQRGRIERHGDIMKHMLHRMDQDQVISDLMTFDESLRMCCQAKNQLTRVRGYSPEQIVLGKSTGLPASLASDDNAAAHSLAAGDDLESLRFKNALDRRTQARQAFIQTENSEAIRRAMLRRSCPTRGPFLPGQLIMYWAKRTKPNRAESGRWCGPAKVVLQEGSSVVWISHADRLLRCAPENLRPASLREWNNHQSDKFPSIVYDNLPQNIIPHDNPAESPEDTYEPSLAPDPLPQPTQPHEQPEQEVSPPTSNPSDHDASGTEPFDTDQELPESADAEPTDDALVLQVSDIPELPMITGACEPPGKSSLFTFDLLQPATSESLVCLAEDGLPYFEEPLECTTEECFVLEIPMKHSDILSWSNETNPEQMCQVAAASQRARSEVQIKTLSLEDRKLFEVAKDNELSCWISTNSLKPILRQKLNPDQILKSRWVLTWKQGESEDGKPPSRKAKARLVVLGYMDPQITNVVRDSPTLSREGRHTILQCLSSYQWELTSFDIKTAFLRGRADESNPLAMEPPKELREKLQLSDQQVCALVGNAYGRVDAPLLFYKELSRHLHELNFRTHPLEPCIFILESGIGQDRILHGVLGTHVDDGVGGGDSYFHKQLKELEKRLPFGSLKYGKFVFTGIQLEQLPDFSITASQKDYIHRILAIDVGKSRREHSDQPATEQEKTKLRGLVGSLQYAVSHTRPDLASRLGEVQSQMANPTVQTLLLCNRVLREAQMFSDVKVCFRHMDPKKITHVSFGDASFASPKQLSSFQGSLIFATTNQLNDNIEAPISPISWSSRKISRVVRSTLSAEAYSMSRSIDRLGWMRLLWGVLAVPQFAWKEPQKAFQMLPKAVITTDCRSLYDLVSRTAMPSCEEYRTTLEVLLIREQCQEHCTFRWIPTTLMLADSLTKIMDTTLLRTALHKGVFCLYDEESCLRYNAQRKDAISWLKSRDKD